MNIQLLQESKDTGRKVVPYTTPSGLRIGVAYTPKPSITQAQCIEYQRAKGYGTAWWIAFCAVSVLALFVIVRTA